MTETAMTETEEAPLIVCLNFCLSDPETGYCLTCGRPPIPVSNVDLSRPLFGGVDLAKLAPSAGQVHSDGDG